MEPETLVGLSIFIIGGLLSGAVWFCGSLLRKRLRGVSRMMIMTVFLILWYATLYPLFEKSPWADAVRRPIWLSIHSIWLWWLIGMVQIERTIRDEAKRSNWKTGFMRGTGVHIVTDELKKIRERKKNPTGGGEGVKDK